MVEVRASVEAKPFTLPDSLRWSQDALLHQKILMGFRVLLRIAIARGTETKRYFPSSGNKRKQLRAQPMVSTEKPSRFDET